MNHKEKEELFLKLFKAPTEQALEKIVAEYHVFSDPSNWRPLGDNPSNYGVIENQQSSPIASLIEKITNSIDAILTKKCLEAGIDPKSSEAPRSIKAAMKQFFPESESWDLPSQRREQAKNIQIIADGKPRNTSVIIYDNGEGQRPERFPKTFLSLLSGNKNEIQFVQGKYNMGGSGAIVFCGKKGYQLIASKRFDGGDFGFSLVREHPLSREESKIKKNTWYEYFAPDGVIQSFPIQQLNLGLFDRQFKTGTILKLYSYQFPSGYSGFAQDLNQSITEYLFEPALPIYTIDNKDRYPNNRVLEKDLFGLKRRLEKEEKDGKYIEESFSETYAHEDFGRSKIQVSCYLFRSKIGEWDFSETKKNIQKQFFKNDMAVMFSLNGQVHGYYTSEFITRSLKMNLLKSHLLIHVDCTEIEYDIRKELFMASRDRLKEGDETKKLRKFLAEELKKSRLKDIVKKRKQSITTDAKDSRDLLSSFTKKLPINSELMKLLGQTFKLDQKVEGIQSTPKKTSSKSSKSQAPFQPQRHPSFLKFKGNEHNSGKEHAVAIPKGGERVVKLETDVEDHYFDRVEEPGDMQIALLGFKEDGSSGGDGPGNKVDTIEQVFNITKSSPDKGTIKIHLAPRKDTQVGEAHKIKISLTAPGEDLEHIFMVKVTEPEQPAVEKPESDQPTEQPLGLPKLEQVYREKREGCSSWEELGENLNANFDHETVMYPLAEGDQIESIYINMDCRVLKNFLSKERNPTEEQIALAKNKYIASVYFHTLFLYSITLNRKYKITQSKDEREQEIDIGEYLQDLFSSYYSEFLLNFGGMEEMMDAMGE